VFLHAGRYKFFVTAPSTLAGIDVLGSPLTIAVTAGPVDASRSSFSVMSPPSLAVGSYLNARIHLEDVYGNLITAPKAGQINDSSLVVYGEQNVTTI
jgi:hypothetical protein